MHSPIRRMEKSVPIVPDGPGPGERKRYPETHWIRSPKQQTVLNAFREQQSKAYSRTKNRFIAELLGDLSGKRFLDFGCGPGLFVLHAARSGALLVVGVDAERMVLSTARFLSSRDGVDHRVQLICSDDISLFRSGECFDTILMKDVLEHLPDDRALLSGVAGIMKPGGQLVMSTQNAFSLNYLLEGTLQRVILRNRDWFGWDPTHMRFYTPFSLRKKLLEAGFECVTWRSIYLVPYKLPSPPWSEKRFLRIDPLSRIDRLIGKWTPFNRLGWNVIVKARKKVL